MIEVTVESIPNHSTVKISLPVLPPVGSTIFIDGYPIRVDNYEFTANHEDVTIKTELNVFMDTLIVA